MLTNETLEELRLHAGLKTMVSVVTMQAILYSTKLIDPGSTAFREKCIRKHSRLLGETLESAEKAMALLQACSMYEMLVSLSGMAGATPPDLLTHLYSERVFPLNTEVPHEPTDV